MTVGGPEILEMRDLARAYKEAMELSAAIVPLPLPPRVGKAMRGGALTIADPDHRGTTTFAEWLRRERSAD